VTASPIDCTLVTCERVPSLDFDDALLLRELRARGLRASVAIWSDRAVDWSASRLCVLRSTWDYYRRPREFAGWIRRASTLTVLRNDPHLLAWNAHKSYLRELELRGVPVVPTAWVRYGESCDLARLVAELGWRDVVLKPAVGAAADGVTLVRAGEPAANGQARLDELTRGSDVLIQPYLAAVAEYGERALIFLDGSFSHAVAKKKPFDTVLTVGDASELGVSPTSAELAVAESALRAVPGERVLYARVDLLRDDAGTPRVSEVELIEPGLYFGAHAPARHAFAAAVARELDESSTVRR
jgi:glutathione synthase/RimK-type ligase-like ATP-grasp enzyme